MPESEEYDTLAGWMLSELGHIPVVGESVRIGSANLLVESVRRRRIARVRVTTAAPPGEDDGRRADEGGNQGE